MGILLDLYTQFSCIYMCIMCCTEVFLRKNANIKKYWKKVTYFLEGKSFVIIAYMQWWSLVGRWCVVLIGRRDVYSYTLILFYVNICQSSFVRFVFFRYICICIIFDEVNGSLECVRASMVKFYNRGAFILNLVFLKMQFRWRIKKIINFLTVLFFGQ